MCPPVLFYSTPSIHQIWSYLFHGSLHAWCCHINETRNIHNFLFLGKMWFLLTSDPARKRIYVRKCNSFHARAKKWKCIYHVQLLPCWSSKIDTHSILMCDDFCVTIKLLMKSCSYITKYGCGCAVINYMDGLNWRRKA